jgi:hypothetical protein
MTRRTTVGNEKNEVKCFANVHMTPAECGLWNLCRSLTAKFNYHLILDGEKLAAHFGTASKSAIYRLVVSLKAKGWFVCTKEPVRVGGKWTHSEYDILSHEEWAQKKKHKSQCRKTEVSPFPSTGMVDEKTAQDRSQVREQTVPKSEVSPFPSTGHSIEYTSILNKEHIEELRSDAEEPLLLNKKAETQRVFGQTTTVPPFPSTGMVDPVVDPFACVLSFERSLGGHKPSWGARRGIGRALTSEESREIARRDAKHLTPEDVIAELHKGIQQ